MAFFDFLDPRSPIARILGGDPANPLDPRGPGGQWGGYAPALGPTPAAAAPAPVRKKKPLGALSPLAAVDANGQPVTEVQAEDPNALPQNTPQEAFRLAEIAQQGGGVLAEPQVSAAVPTGATNGATNGALLPQPQQSPGFFDRLNARPDSDALHAGLRNAAAHLMSNDPNAFSKAYAGFNTGYEGKIAFDKAEKTPKVIPLNDGAQSMLVFPDGTQKIVQNAEVQQYITGLNTAKSFADYAKATELARIALGGKQQAVADKAVLDNAGTASQVHASIGELRSIASDLGRTDTATGPIIGNLPKAVRDVITPEGAALQDRATKVIQGGMRAVLGGQYTQAEADGYIARSYNPRLPEAENQRRITQIADEMENMLQNKEAALAYFQKHGTTQGFKAGAAVTPAAGTPAAPAPAGKYGGQVPLGTASKKYY